jgi:hypothetical protein
MKDFIKHHTPRHKKGLVVSQVPYKKGTRVTAQSKPVKPHANTKRTNKPTKRTNSPYHVTNTIFMCFIKQIKYDFRFFLLNFDFLKKKIILNFLKI